MCDISLCVYFEGALCVEQVLHPVTMLHIVNLILCVDLFYMYMIMCV